jgi:hypothetical protein
MAIVRLLREELGLLQQPGSYVGEVVKVMGTKKVLVKVHPEGKYGAQLQHMIMINGNLILIISQSLTYLTMSTSRNSLLANESLFYLIPTNSKKCSHHQSTLWYL